MTRLSMTPCDKRFRKCIAKEITEICDESIDKEDFRNRLIFVVDNMLRSKTTAILRVEKEQ